MNVKDKRNPVDTVLSLLKDQNGVLFTADLVELGIPRTYLSILEKKGEIQRVARGVYSTATGITDEMAALQYRYKNAIFSHETALYLFDLTDRTPLFYSVTVPSGYNATSLKASGAKVYFIKPALFLLGKTTVKTTHGNAIKTYNLERTICDMIRSRNQIDVQFINEALKRYVRRSDRDLDQLYRYASQFRIQKIVRAFIEVLL